MQPCLHGTLEFPCPYPQSLATLNAKPGSESWIASHTRRAIGSDSGDLDLDFDDVFGNQSGGREKACALSAAPSVEVSTEAGSFMNRKASDLAQYVLQALRANTKAKKGISASHICTC